MLERLHFNVLTLFPEMFDGFLHSSIIKRAHEKNIVKTTLTNFRDFSDDKHKTVDDTPYGGGGGMLLKPEPVFKAIEHLSQGTPKDTPVVLMSPQGEPYTQEKARYLTGHRAIILICGHYEGIDERIRENLVTDEISVGDYVLTGGEVPSMIVMDSVTRLLPGVLGNKESCEKDSFSNGLLEYPQYTKPREFMGHSVPEVLLSGNHKKIEEWKRNQSLLRTYKRRPDLLENICLSPEDKVILSQVKSSE